MLRETLTRLSVQSHPGFSGGGHVFIIPRYVRCSITLSLTNFSLVLSPPLFLSVYPLRTLPPFPPPPFTRSSVAVPAFAKAVIFQQLRRSRRWTSPQSTRTLISLEQVSWVKNRAVVTASRETTWSRARGLYLRFFKHEIRSQFFF